MKALTETPLTAREMRVRTRESESHASRLLLIQGIAEELAGERVARDGLASALSRITRHLQVESALVLQPTGGALTVVCGIGPVLPIGASLPGGGVIGDAMRPPMQAVLREHVASRFRIASPVAGGYEWLLPLRLAARCHGVLAVLGDRGSRLPDQDDQTVLSAVTVLLAGVMSTGPTPKSRRPTAQAAATMTRLTAREQQVLSLLPTGASNADIAARLGIAPGTAKIHVERILHKLGVRDRTAAAMIAVECGLRP